MTTAGFQSIEELGRFISNDPTLSFLKREAEKQLQNDPSHDIFHALRVALWTIRLNPKGNVYNAITAALLHDFVNIPKDDPRRAFASELSANEARKLLSQLERYSSEDIDDICDAIRDHSFSRGSIPVSELGMALQDADRLEALGVLGVFRNISCGTLMQAKFFCPEDPWGKSRDLNDKRFSVDHYPIKLFKLEETMNTELGKREATIRTNRMKRMLIELGEEIGSECDFVS